MPKYVTRTDIVDRYGEDIFTQVADLDCDGVADINPVDTAILDAEACADSFLGIRYLLPLPGIISAVDPVLNTVPPTLKRVVVDIAVYFLVSDHPTLTEERTKRFENAKKWLMMIGDGEVALGLDVPPPTRGGTVKRTGPDRQFTRDKTRGLL